MTQIKLEINTDHPMYKRGFADGLKANRGESGENRTPHEKALLLMRLFIQAEENHGFVILNGEWADAYRAAQDALNAICNKGVKE